MRKSYTKFVFILLFLFGPGAAAASPIKWLRGLCQQTLQPRPPAWAQGLSAQQVQDHFLAKLREKLPASAFVTDQFFYLDVELQATPETRESYDRIRAQQFMASLRAAEVKSPGTISAGPITQYTWLYGRVRADIDGLTFYNWQPDTYIHASPPGGWHYKSIDEVNARLATEILSPHFPALGDDGRTWELVVETYPYTKFLDEKGELISDWAKELHLALPSTVNFYVYPVPKTFPDRLARP